MRKFIAGIVVFIFGNVPGISQSCVSINNNAVINFSCGVNCAPLTIRVPDLRSSSDYNVTAIAYNPLPYTTAAPALSVPCTSQDDKFFDTVFLPFPFCFYDSLYTKCVLGTNGLITFDVSNVLLGNNWDFDPPLSIPNIGTGSAGTGNCATPNGTLFPRASVMGPYTDIYPQASDGLYKIEVRTEGTSPCRKYVISFSQVQMFSCTSNRVTSQMVLHESTGIIEIFVQSKPFCSFNGNNAVIGIQDWTRTRGVAAPGRNTGSWTAQNEAYRFTPSGGVSRFISSELYTMGGSLVTTATASGNTPGLIDLTFPNVCPAGNSQQFVVRTKYSSCNDPNTIITTEDTITVNKTNSLNATANVANINCASGGAGSITVNVPANSGTPPYSYSINGGPMQSNNVFSGLTTGNYVVFATDPNGCSSTLNLSITQSGSLTSQVSTANTACSGVNNGSITVFPLSGTAPYQYSINGGPLQSSNIFSNLAPGSYSIFIRDAFGCTQTQTAIVNAGTGLTASISAAPTSCSGASNGMITINPNNGTAPHQYSLNGGPFQPLNSFSGLMSGSYTVTIRDANNCTSVFNVTVPAGAPLNATMVKTDVLCYGGNNGSIVINVTNGSAPYQYSLNNVTWQAANSFTGLTAGTYTVYYRDINSCSNSQQVILTQPAVISAVISVQPVVCFGQNNGQISVTAAGGVAPYQYSLDGITYQSGNSFSTAAGNYIVFIKDNNGCIRNQNLIMTEPPQIVLNLSMQNASCNGGADGRITAAATGGTGALQYSIDGINFQSTGIFNVMPGTYTITAKDVNNCTTAQTVTVGLNNNLSLTPAADLTICEGSSAQLNVITNANQFSWSPAVALNNPSVQNPVANPVVTTQYIVTATFGQCTGRDTIMVNVNAAPVPEAGPDGNICYGQNFRLQGSGGVQYNWSPSSSLSSSAVSNPLSTPAQTITYSLSVIDANGCPSLVQDQVVVNVTPPIVIRTYPRDTIVYSGDQFQLLATSAGTNYSWSPPAGLNNSFIPDPVLTVSNDVLLQVTATTSAGCRGDATVNIKVYKGPDIYMPTGFTPNGDGRNDKFKPFPVGITKLNYFRVYNRWGQQLYSTTVLHEGWDGRLGGVDQPLGTYVWMVQGVTRLGKIITKKGTVTLIR
jgi:gliding motility-associated-like protein